jgi:hypothetical protein
VFLPWWLALPFWIVYATAVAMWWLILAIFYSSAAIVLFAVAVARELRKRRARPAPLVPHPPMPPSDGYVTCPEHGDLYVQPGAGCGTAIDPLALRPLRADVARPTMGSSKTCPLCGRVLRFDSRTVHSTVP